MNKVLIILISLALFSCKPTVPAELTYLTEKPLVMVLKSAGKIQKVEVFETLPKEGFSKSSKEEMTLVVFGTAVSKGEYGAEAKGTFVGMDLEDNLVNIKGMKLNFRFEVTAEVLSEIDTYLKSKK